jgi:hypothetical protein
MTSGTGKVRVAGAVAGVGGVDDAPPRARPLLGLAHQDEAEEARGCAIAASW